jgi:hypothetical protein
MSRSPFSLVAVAALALVAGGCSAPEEVELALPSSWAGQAARDPIPTGIMLVGAPSADAVSAGPIVTDGSGTVWVGGPAQVTRLNPATGRTTTWDVADDAAFAPLQMAPASGTGVWLIGPQDLHLFNGQQFLADLTLPGDIVESSPGDASAVSIMDVVEARSELWLSLFESVPGDGFEPGVAGRVLRWSDGQWTQVAAIEDGANGAIAVDTVGGVWAGGLTNPPVGVEPGIRRFDGTTWTTPGADDPDFPRGTGDVVADPTGGVWFLENTGVGHHLSHFDGTTWRLVSDDVNEQVGDMWAWNALVVSRAGDAWMPGSSAVVRYSADGTTRSYAAEQGVAPEYGGAPAVTIAGEDVLVHQRSGVLKLAGDRFTPVWKDDVWAPVRTVGLAAVSADEVWTQAQRSGEATPPPGAPEGFLQKPTGWVRYRDGAWQEVGAETTGWCGAALATDSAIWATTTEGLMRVAGDDVQVLWPGLPDCGVLAGAGGSVWVLVDGAVTGVSPDGARTAIGRPDGFEDMGMWAAGDDGSLWVSGWVDGTSRFARWDGRAWTPVDVPNPDALSSLAVSDDGAAWAAFTGDGPGDPASRLGRWAGGSWTYFAEYMWTVVDIPGGRACGESAGSEHVVVCFDATGEVSRHELSELDEGWDVAPDGTVWAVGGQVGRLPWRVAAG